MTADGQAEGQRRARTSSGEHGARRRHEARDGKGREGRGREGSGVEGGEAASRAAQLHRRRSLSRSPAVAVGQRRGMRVAVRLTPPNARCASSAAASRSPVQRRAACRVCCLETAEERRRSGGSESLAPCCAVLSRPLVQRRWPCWLCADRAPCITRRQSDVCSAERCGGCVLASPCEMGRVTALQQAAAACSAVRCGAVRWQYPSAGC